MWSRRAALTPLLFALQHIAASSAPDSPNSVESTQAAVPSRSLLDISPRITDSPILDPRGLAGRANVYERNSNTCAFWSDGDAFTCDNDNATCVYGSKFAACCDVGTTCSSIHTGCYNLNESRRGSCHPTKLKTEPQMACCNTVTAPSCVLHTLLISSTSLSMWACAANTEGKTLYATNPSLKTTSESESSTTTTSATSTDSGTADHGGGGKSSPNIGVIVGAVVGGVGGLAIIAATIIFFVRSRKQSSAGNSPGTAAAAQPMLRHQQSPPLGQGSPFGFHPDGGGAPYDPSTAYQQYQRSPQHSQSPYDPHQSGHVSWAASSWGQPSPGLASSLGPAASVAPSSSTPGAPSPGQQPSQSGQSGQSSQSNAIGTPENRAELG